LASFSTTMGRLIRAESLSRKGSWRHARLGANSTVERFSSIQPAAPIPTASTEKLAHNSLTTSTIRSSVAAVSSAGVGRRLCATTVPSSSTTPPSTLVPPMSTPMVYVTAVPFRRPGFSLASA
jgi:hypothetical protein